MFLRGTNVVGDSTHEVVEVFWEEICAMDYEVVAVFLGEDQALEYIESKTRDEQDSLYITKDMFSGSYEVVKIK